MLQREYSSEDKLDISNGRCCNSQGQIFGDNTNNNNNDDDDNILFGYEFSCCIPVLFISIR